MAHGDKKDTLTRDIYESVRAILGKHVKILERCSVRLETKGDKTESRILVFTPCRLFVFTSKIPTKIDFNIHYLDLQAIESKKLTHLTLSTADKAYSFHTQEELNQTSDSLITAIVTAISDLFPGVPIDQVVRRIELSPVGRIENLSNLLRGSANDTELNIPCGNFSRQYACMCDYYGLPYREEVAWDVDTIYMSHNSKELNLRDFDHLDPKDLIPIIAALELNSYFLRFRCSHLKLSHECSERLLSVLKKSTTLEEVYADNAGVKSDFANKLSMAILSNTNSSLQGLDLSHNLIEDRGATQLSSSLSKVHRGLVKLSLSHCGLTGKGVAQIGHALSLNKFMASSLVHLDLSNNSIKDDITSLCSYLAQPNVLTHLNLANTETSLEPIFGALLRGCTTRLSYLDVSKNVFSTKKGKELPPSFKQYFTSSLALRHVALAQCKITPEALKNLLLGLACNESIEGVLLDLSNNILGNGGCHVLESCIHGVRCLSTLDISDNGIDVEMAGVLLSICRNKSLKHLILNKNFQNLKSKHAATVIDAFVHLLQEEDCVIETLNLIDCKLKSELYSLINAVGSNQSLQHLDLTGNYIGDPGARLLSKALQINTSLKTLAIDRNSITVHGYSDIAYALESNRTLRYLPYPLHDIMVAAKAGPEKVDSLWKQIQESLQRNVVPSQTGTTPTVRLQQGAMLSSTQQLLDRLVNQTSEAIRNVQRQGNDSKAAEVEVARGLLDDAHGAKQLLGKLMNCVEVAQENSALNATLQPMLNDVQAVLTSHLQNIGDSLIRCARTQCSGVLACSTLTDQLKKSVESKSLFPSKTVQSTLLENGCEQLLSKCNEIAVAMASHICDLVVDEVVESLSDSYKNLVGESSRLSAEKKRSSTPDVLKSRTRLNSELVAPEVQGELDNSHHSSDHSPVATPQMSLKRKGVASRKVRPKSVVGFVQSGGMSADDIPDLVPPLNDGASQAEEADANEEEVGVNVDEVADSNADVSKSSAPLKHLGLSRPKKPKTRLPTRTAARIGNSQTASQESLDMDADLSQGLDTFFHTTTMATTTGGSSVSLGSSRIRGSLGSVSSAELGSPSLESMSADSSPMHRSCPGDASKTGNEEAGSSREELDQEDEKESEKIKKSDEDVTAGNKDKRKDSGRGMGVRLLSSLFGKNPSPSPTSDVVSNPLTKSPVSKTRLSSSSKDINETTGKLSEGDSKSSDKKNETDLKGYEADETSEKSISKRAAAPSKIGIGVGGNVLAEMKARQERRISSIMKQNSEESDFSERSERTEMPKSNMSPLPLGAVRLRPTPPTPEEPEAPETPKLDGKIGSNSPVVRFRSPGSDDVNESDRNKSSSANPLANIRLRPRGFTDSGDTESSVKSEEKTSAVGQFRLRAATGPSEEPEVFEKSDSKSNPLTGVRLRSTGINVTDPLKSPNNGGANNGGSNNGDHNDNKNEARNSLTKLKPPPLAPKPRPWSIVGSDKKTDDTENAEAAKENDAKELIKPASKVRAMAATLNSTNTEVARRTSKPSLTDSEDQDERPVDQPDANDPAAKSREAQPHSTTSVQHASYQSPSLILDNFTLEDAVDV